MRKIKVYLNDGPNKRKVVEAEVISESATAYNVKLPDGNVIKRKKNRDIPMVKSAKTEETTKKA